MSREDLSVLVERIREEFPDFKFTTAEFHGEGLDHTILLIDNEWIFRFRKPGADTGSMEQEVRLLKALRLKSDTPVPEYRWLSKDRNFGGYRAMRGIELTVRRYRLLSDTVQRSLALELGKFLSSLHGLPPSLISQPLLNPVDCRYPAYYKERYHTKRRAVLATGVDTKLLSHIDAFYDEFYFEQPKRLKVVHVDLKDKHVLLSPASDRIAGILDFTDATLWDPARDFAFLWGFGPTAVQVAYQSYAFHDDPHFISRSQWQAARLFIDRVYYDIQEPRPTELVADISALKEILKLLAL